MTAKRAKKVRLGNHVVTIKFVPLLVEDHCDDGEQMSGTLFGFYDTNSGTVYVDPNHDQARVQDTLIHELLHVIDIEYGLGLSHSKINVIATGLQQLLSPYLKKI
jgi:hypothetical protein